MREERSLPAQVLQRSLGVSLRRAEVARSLARELLLLSCGRGRARLQCTQPVVESVHGVRQAADLWAHGLAGPHSGRLPDEHGRVSTTRVPRRPKPHSYHRRSEQRRAGKRDEPAPALGCRRVPPTQQWAMLFRHSWTASSWSSGFSPSDSEPSFFVSPFNLEKAGGLW